MFYSLIDSHCHLQLPAYDADRASVLKGARAAGIGLIAVGTNFATSEAAVRLAEANPEGVWATIAVHPGHVHRPHHDESETTVPPTAEFFDRAIFEKLAASPKVVAIGETGLDYYRLAADEEMSLEQIKARQKENFISHLKFAKEKNLPLTMHVRDAHDDAYEILKSEGRGLRGVMHCFTGTVTEAERYLDLGFYISFTGVLAFPPKKGEEENALATVCRMVPAERLLVETDAPWLTPPPFRGQRNDPFKVRITAQAVARIRRTDLAEIEKITTANAIHLFNLAEPS